MVYEELIKVPSYALQQIKYAFSTPDNLVMTATARRNAYALGFSEQDIVDAIASLKDIDFYKSMKPLNLKFTALQDVYKTVFKGIRLYIKFQINSRKELILSFKEDTSYG